MALFGACAIAVVASVVTMRRGAVELMEGPQLAISSRTVEAARPLGHSGVTKDSDGDGYTDADEEELGTDPANGDSYPWNGEAGFEDLSALVETRLTRVGTAHAQDAGPGRATVEVSVVNLARTAIVGPLCVVLDTAKDEAVVIHDASGQTAKGRPYSYLDLADRKAGLEPGRMAKVTIRVSYGESQHPEFAVRVLRKLMP